MHRTRSIYLAQSMMVAIEQLQNMFKILNRDTKKQASQRRCRNKILEKNNSKSLTSKEQKKLILMLGQFKKINKA